MPHDTGLIATITFGLAFAFLAGLAAAKLRLPPIVGYLLAGVAIGPFTPGFVADRDIARQLAEIGVVLLMFGVGIHFSLRDLAAVRRIAIPGAIGQITVATALAVLVSGAFGAPAAVGVVLGLAVSVASTVVLLRALEERGALDSLDGHIAVGWLIVEDLFTVLVLVLLPVLALFLVEGGQRPATPLDIVVPFAVVALKVAALGALTLFVGTRAVPWLLAHVARVGSRELFTLAVLAIALGVAFGSATLFGVSLALGAFLAGAVVSESDFSHQAAAEALPFRDAFAVLFFVSVGMLFEPAFILNAPFAVLGILLLVVLGKALAAFVIVLAFGYPVRTGLTVAVGLAQIGEFSFILSDLALGLRLLPPDGHQLILAAALGSITLNPFLFRAIDPLDAWLRERVWLSRLLARRAGPLARRTEASGQPLRSHTVICGHGSVGSVVATALARRGFRFVVIEQDRRLVEALRRDGVDAIYGDAASAVILGRAGVADARVLIVSIPDAPATRRIVEYARGVNAAIDIAARTHSEDEWRFLRDGRVNAAFWGEREVAVELASHALRRFGVSSAEIATLAAGLRRR